MAVPTKRPKVATVIVSWNNEDILDGCYKSLADQDYKNHVTLLVDNGSKDNSVKYTKTAYPWVEVCEAGANLGFAKGNNKGIKHITDRYPSVEYIILLNSDARLRSDWISTMVNFAQKKGNGAIYQSVTLDYYNNDIIDSSYISIARNGAGTQHGWRKLYRGEVGPRRIFGANAAAAMISRKFIDAQPYSGLFDETMFMYLEDVDISARATVMGFDNYLVPKTEAYHMGSESSNKRPGFSFYLTYRNNIALLVKNIPFPLLVRMIPLILQGDYHTARHLARRGQYGAIWIMIKGRFMGVVRLPLYTRNIILMHKHRKQVSREYLWSLMDKGAL